MDSSAGLLDPSSSEACHHRRRWKSEMGSACETDLIKVIALIRPNSEDS